MNVLHVVPSYLPATRYGGPIYSVHGLCRALSRIGHDVSVFTTNIDGPNDSDVPLGQPVALDGVKVWYFPSTFLRRLYWAPKLLQVLRKQITLFDIVHLHSVFLWPTWAAARCAQEAGIPYIIAPRGMLVQELIRRKSRWLKTAWIKLIEQRSIAGASGLHVTSPIEQQEIEKFGLNLPPVFYVPNGVEEIDPRFLEGAESELVPDFPYVLFLSRINWKKGLDRLIKAWHMVPDLQLIIAGNDEENYQEEMEKLAQAEGVSDRICFIGPAYGKDKWLLYQHAELFVLPSSSENFGIVVLEAMSMGCPVVVTAGVGMASTVAEERCGLVVDATPDILAASIRSLLDNKQLLKEMGERGRAIAANRFSWSSIAKEMEAAYEAVIAQPRT